MKSDDQIMEEKVKKFQKMMRRSDIATVIVVLLALAGAVTVAIAEAVVVVHFVRKFW